jgi:hypothetical protein
MDPDLTLVRAEVATVTAYMFFKRGVCGACALRGDIVVDDNFVTLLLRQEKGKKALGVGLTSVRQIPYREAPRFAALLRAFFAGHHSMEGRLKTRQRRWALGPYEDLALWSAVTVSGWLLEACNIVKCTPRRFKLNVARDTTSLKGLLPQLTTLVLA